MNRFHIRGGLVERARDVNTIHGYIMLSETRYWMFKWTSVIRILLSWNKNSRFPCTEYLVRGDLKIRERRTEGGSPTKTIRYSLGTVTTIACCMNAVGSDYTMSAR